MIKHAAGWLEGGLCASFEKMVMDAEMLQMMTEVLLPVQVDDDTLGLDAVREVGPGGHFFGCAHTLERYQTAFYPPILSDWRNYETWQEAGSPTSFDHANRLKNQLLAEYEAPPLDPSVGEELEAFVARRKQEGGVL
jgi:trimethylamine--corrinoid protein Co-methyltransferase